MKKWRTKDGRERERGWGVRRKRRTGGYSKGEKRQTANIHKVSEGRRPNVCGGEESG